eukprot:m.59386 g.59386  ORF g.59386 m.59386 type:complete len:77 (+) comp11318_c0_seq1:2188-2418(+)
MVSPVVYLKKNHIALPNQTNAVAPVTCTIIQRRLSFNEVVCKLFGNITTLNLLLGYSNVSQKVRDGHFSVCTAHYY